MSTVFVTSIGKKANVLYRGMHGKGKMIVLYACVRCLAFVGNMSLHMLTNC